MASPLGIDKSRFGAGYLTEGEKSGSFVFTGDHIKFDSKQGVGGATPVQGYDGPWPIFGQSKDSWEAHAIASPDVYGSGPSEIVSKTANQAPRMICKSIGRCSACPKKERNRPYCQPYGNRAPIECRPVTMLEVSEKPSSSANHKPSNNKPNPINGTESSQTADFDDLERRELQKWPRQGEPIISNTLYKGYQTCGRDRVQETWDYSEFIGLNLLLALGGIFLLVRRQRLLAGQHQAMLARRIGRI